MANRANMALAMNTKSNYQTVKNNILRCEEAMDCDLSFPWETSKTLNFLAYLLFTREVKAKTANCQLSGVRMAHLELGLDSPSLRPPIVELLLKGTEHWESVSTVLSRKTMRTPVTSDMMLAMKRIIFEVNWSLEQKYIFWTVCCLLWAGSLRVHEVLSRTQDSYDPQTTLLGRDLTLTKVRVGGEDRDLIQLTLKSPKEDRIGNGTTIEIFGNGSFLCPVKALDRYIKIKGGAAKVKTDKPFFLQSNKVGYTGKSFNNQLKQLTADITDSTGQVVRSHSFRAGVPSTLARLGASAEQIKGVGRWNSDAWKVYCRLGRTRRMNMVDEICRGLPS
jgi:hypothetical protein